MMVQRAEQRDLPAAVSRPRRDTGIYTLGLLSAQAISAISFLILANFLNPAGFGQLMRTISLLAVAVVLIDFGGTNHAVREISRDIGQMSQLVSAAFARLLICVAAAAAIAVLLDHLRSKAAVAACVLYASGIWVSQFSNGLLRAAHGPVWAVSIAVLDKGVSLLLLTTVNPVGQMYAMLCLTGGALVSAVALVAAIARHPATELPRQRWLSPPYTGTFSFGVVSTAAVLRRLDTFVISLNIVGPQLGYFALAQRTIGPLQIGAQAINMAQLPHLARSPHLSMKEMARHQAHLVIAMWTILLTVAVLAPQLLNLFAGARYSGAASVLSLMCAGLCFGVVSVLLQSWAMTHRAERRVAVVQSLSTLIYLALVWSLSYAFGAAGGGLAFLIAEFMIAAALAAWVPSASSEVSARQLSADRRLL